MWTSNIAFNISQQRCNIKLSIYLLRQMVSSNGAENEKRYVCWHISLNKKKVK